jgi:hypothetical protein
MKYQMVLFVVVAAACSFVKVGEERADVENNMIIVFLQLNECVHGDKIRIGWKFNT